jgi:hypothetical protein
MKLRLLFLTAITTAALASCNGNGTTKNKTITAADTPANNGIVYEDSRESLPLSIADTITKSEMRFFSNNETKDLFQLKIDPGMVKNSKARLEILNSTGNVIYTQTFDAFFFVQRIYEPDTIPTTGGQEEYDAFMQQYWKSLTLPQYEACFNKSVDSFFTYIYHIENNNVETIKSWTDEISDKEFMEELLQNLAIKLIDVPCFDCKEGGYTIGYSRKRNKVATLIEHD